MLLGMIWKDMDRCFVILLQIFNDFIDEIGVVDVLVIGKRFTRSDANVSKLSNLDFFLVYEDIYDTFQSLQVVVLDRKWSNHCPILLHDQSINYG